MDAQTYILASKVFYTVLAALSAVGVICNSILLFTTIRSKSLRTPCNILIGACALFDIGSFNQSTQVYGETTIDSRTCVAIMFPPAMGVVAGSFAVLSIGIDRFLSIAVPNRYRNMNAAAYLTAHFLAIFLFCVYNAFLIAHSHVDTQLVCNAMSIYHDEARSWWGYSSAAVNLIAVLVYMVTLSMIKAQARDLESEKLRRIFRTIALVTAFDIGGWSLTQIVVASMSFARLPDEQRLCYHTLAGIPVNFGIAIKLIVFYWTSTDYRKAVSSQLTGRRQSTPLSTCPLVMRLKQDGSAKTDVCL